MLKNKRKVMLSLICIVLLFLFCYKIFSNHNNVTVTETVIANAKSEKVSMPYINPEWTEYMKLSEEERKDTKAPQMYIYDYIPDKNTDYSDLPSKYNLRDKYPTTLYDQGNEGLCWAYSNVEMLESNLKVTQGKDVQFSIDHLDILTTNERYYEGEYNPYGLAKTDRSGLSYNDEQKFNYALLSSGLFPVLKEKFTITKNENQVYVYKDIANTDNIDYTITSTVDFPKYNNTPEFRNMMKDFIINYGAIRISTTGLFDENNIINIKEGERIAGHEMIIVGWDDSYRIRYR